MLLTLYFIGKKRTLLLESCTSRTTTQEEKKEQDGEENKSLFSVPPHEGIIEKKTDEDLSPKTWNGIDKLQ